jgi:uncharacterized protein YjbJ (UPF0337 family)
MPTKQGIKLRMRFAPRHKIVTALLGTAIGDLSLVWRYRGRSRPRHKRRGHLMNTDRIEGVARDVGGKIQDAAGGLTGDAVTQLRGKAEQVAGKTQRAYGQAVDGVRDFAQDQPVGALLAALGVGVALGLVLGRR